jgi:hypothetical protein
VENVPGLWRCHRMGGAPIRQADFIVLLTGLGQSKPVARTWLGIRFEVHRRRDVPQARTHRRQCGRRSGIAYCAQLQATDEHDAGDRKDKPHKGSLGARATMICRATGKSSDIWAASPEATRRTVS